MKKLFFYVPILAIVFLLGLFLSMYFGEANGGVSNVRVTNLTSNSVTISWETKQPGFGSIVYSKEDFFPDFIGKYIAKYREHDDRNVSKDLEESGRVNLTENFDESKAQERRIHHVTISGLEAETTYFFRIDGNIKLINPEVNSFTTLSQNLLANEPDPVYGSVINYMANQKNPTDGIVYYRVVNKNNDQITSQWYSSIIKNENWSGDLSKMVDTLGQVVNWNSSDYLLNVEAKTPEGEGGQNLTLETYKPIETIIVNIRYIP